MDSMKQPYHFLFFPETITLFETFEQNKTTAMFVGGCVRDAILGKNADDFDIAVSAPIFDVVSMLERANIKCIKTAPKYASIKAVVGKRTFDVTSLRKDTKCFGRSCDISIVKNFDEDAARRDFTINAVYVDIAGNIFDYFGGVDDIKKRRVLFIGDPLKRIREDVLRILRYYRFCSLLSDYSGRYSNILKDNAFSVSVLPLYRMQTELSKMIQSEQILDMMKKDGILDVIARCVSQKS
jgi:poly(A) polymerase